MELYYAIHLLVFFCLAFEFSRNIKLKLNVIKCLMLFFVLFGGLRWEIGNDWEQYRMLFEHLSWDNFLSFDRYGNGGEKLEPGFALANVLVKSIFGTRFYIYNIILQIFIQYTYYIFSKEFSPKRPLLIYAFLMVLRPNYFAVRAGFAISILFWAYKYIRDQNLKKFLIVVLLASSVHFQCLVLIPFYWAGRIKISFYIYSMIFWSFAALGYLYRDYFIVLASFASGDIGEKLAFYTSCTNDGVAGYKILSSFTNYFFIINFFYVKKYIRKDKEHWYYALLNMCLVFNAFLAIFSEEMTELVRLAIAFFPAYIILLVNAFNTYLDSNKMKIICILFICVFYLYKLPQPFYSLYFEETCVPYKTIFNFHNIN